MALLNNSTDLISYKEAIITVPANGQYVYQNPYNFIRILDSNGGNNDLFFRFGTSSIETLLTVGLGLRFNELLPSVTIRNASNAPVTIRISEIAGDILDDRLSISGEVKTIEQAYTVRQVTSETFDANGEVAIDSTNYKRVIIQNNSVSDSCFVFTNNTFELQPNGTFDLNYAGQFTVYGTAGQNISLCYLA